MLGSTELNFSKGYQAGFPRMRYKTILLLSSIIATSQAAGSDRDLAALLNSQSCDGVWDNVAFSMDVLSRSFPVPRGFRFVGIESDSIVFRRTLNHSDEIASQLDKNVDATLQQKTFSLNQKLASITYGEKRDIVLGSTGVERDVTVLQWNGLDIFLWSSVGGSVVETKTYQAVVQAKDMDYQIGVAALDLGLVSELIGCSE